MFPAQWDIASASQCKQASAAALANCFRNFDFFCVPLTLFTWLLKIEPKASCPSADKSLSRHVHPRSHHHHHHHHHQQQHFHFSSTEKLLALASGAFRAPPLAVYSGAWYSSFQSDMTKLPKALRQNSKNVRLTDLGVFVLFLLWWHSPLRRGGGRARRNQFVAGVLLAWNSSRQSRVEESNDFKPQHDHPSHKKLRPEGYST